MLIKPIKIHGGKHHLAGQIVELLSFIPHTRYVEPFAGGLSVLLRKDPEGVAEFVNDTNRQLINFWDVLASADDFPEFQRLVEATPFGETAFDRAKFAMEISSPDHTIHQAVYYFVMMRQSRQGLGKDYCTPTRRLRRGMNEQVSAWLTAVDGLADIHERLRRVEIWNRDAVECITRLDTEETAFYCDPPYLHSTRSTTEEYGENEMSDEQHRTLLNALSNIKGKFLLSGYRSELYDDLALSYGWSRIDIESPNHASSSKSKEVKIESIWMN